MLPEKALKPRRASSGKPDNYSTHPKLGNISGLGFRVLDLGFPKIRGTCLGVPITRTIVFGGVYWDPSI